MSVEAYPLHWPGGWPRTTYRARSRFNTSETRAYNNMLGELRRLGATNVVVSTMLKLRQDGHPYASQRIPEDPGVAVYFTYKKKQSVIAADKWYLIGDNYHAIGKCVEAMRGMERWGAGTMMDKAFEGFESLPAPEDGAAVTRQWFNVLGVAPGASRDELRLARIGLAKRYHPDSGREPSHEKMCEVNEAYEQATA